LRGLNRYAPSVVVLIAACAVLFAGPMLVDRLQFAQEKASVQLARLELKNSPLLTQLNNSFQSISRLVGPSVVHITIERDSTGGILGQQSLPSQGSGWVFDDRGHIVTNHHVVDRASRIEVRFSDGLPHQAEYVGGDESTDIAVIRVDSRRVVPVSRASGMQVQQGDLVFAFGSPFGFEFSMSSGIVSGHGRQAHLSQHGYENYIQTDAAINPGNSGGPLTNVYGELVGMNMAIAVDPKDPVRSGRFTGVGLAIPLDIIEFVVGQIISGQPIQRGGLGIRLRDLGPEDGALIRELGLPESGVLIHEVQPGSPAHAAGLRAGDVILQASGQSMTRTETFRTMIHNLLPGSVVRLEVWREKSLHTFDVVLGDWVVIDAPNVLEEVWGLTVTTLTATDARRAGLSAASGVRVEAVRPDSPGDRLGILAGWVIVALGGEAAPAPTDLIRLLHQVREGAALELECLDAQGRRTTRTLSLTPEP